MQATSNGEGSATTNVLAVKNEFDIENNHKGDCGHHPGESHGKFHGYLHELSGSQPGEGEVDEEARCWRGHRDDMYEGNYEDYGPPTYADGFPWTCCHEPANGPPCKDGTASETRCN